MQAFRRHNNKDTIIPFCNTERAKLLAVKGVGPTVVARLEQMGFVSLDHLAKANALDILSQGAKLTGSSCWKNSPQVCTAVHSAIAVAARNK